MYKAIIFTGTNFYDLGRKGHGPRRIATHCKPYGWEIEIADYLSFWSYEQIESFLKSRVVPGVTKWLGFSYTWLSNDNETTNRINFIKKLYPDLLLIAGGQAPFQEDLGVDYYIYGYGEEACLKVLQYEFHNGPPVLYTRLFGGKYIDGVHNYTSANLKEYASEWEESDFLLPSEHLTMEVSRGCKFSCKFCNYPYIGLKDDTSRSEESIYRELNENYQKWGITNYLVADDTFNDRTEKLIKFRNAVKRLDFTPNFSGYIRIDLLKAHPEQLEILAESRFWGHFYGIETFTHSAGKIIGKGMHPDLIKEQLLATRAYFNKHVGYFRATASMIAGLPTESIEQMHESNKWLMENWSDQIATWHPLQIISHQESIQAFGLNLAKYGYTILPPATIEQDAFYRDKTLFVKPIKNQIYWKNEHTDNFEVMELCNEWRKFHWGISNFSLWTYCTHFPLDEVMKLRMPAFEVYNYPPYADRSKIMIEEYIAKKLNYNPQLHQSIPSSLINETQLIL